MVERRTEVFARLSELREAASALAGVFTDKVLIPFYESGVHVFCFSRWVCGVLWDWMGKIFAYVLFGVKIHCRFRINFMTLYCISLNVNQELNVLTGRFH